MVKFVSGMIQIGSANNLLVLNAAITPSIIKMVVT